MKLTSSSCVPVFYVSRKVAKEQRRKEEINCENNRKLSKSHQSITIKYPVNPLILYFDLLRQAQYKSLSNHIS
jgi:hypothetical protein